MAQVPPRGRRTTEAVRRAIRASSESASVLARRYGIDPKTAAKWKNREHAGNLPRGPKAGLHRKLTDEEESIVVQFREHTLLPLDDCLFALQAHMPHLTRSSLHRCLQRHGISRLPKVLNSRISAEQELPKLGELYIDRSQVRSRDGSHILFNAVEQWSKFVFVRMGTPGETADAADFLASLAARSPFRIGRVFTLDAEPFVRNGDENPFARVCHEHGIEHRLISDRDPWTCASGARIGRALQENVTLASEAYLAHLLGEFVHAYNVRRRLKTLGGKTPYAYLCAAWLEHPERFQRDPHHELLGLEIMHP